MLALRRQGKLVGISMIVAMAVWAMRNNKFSYLQPKHVVFMRHPSPKEVGQWVWHSREKFEAVTHN